MRLTDILPFVTAAFSMAAATFFVPLVLGIFWRGAHRAGAIAAMVVGPAVTLGYMLRNLAGARTWFGLDRLWSEDGRWFGIEPMAAGVFGVAAAALALVLFSLLLKAPADNGGELLDRLRSPPPVP